MRILHTSDWHLGRIFHQFSLIDEQRHALLQIIEAIEEHKPEVVIIAGDIYDRSIPPASAIGLFNEFVDQCIGTLKVPIIAISGNHDGAERLGFAANQLKHSGLHLVTSLDQMQKPITLADEYGDVDFWAVPFHDPAQVADFTGSPQTDFYQAHCSLIEQLPINKKHRNVMISHCYLDGANESESERPLTIGGADRVDWKIFKPFCYTALGHLHQPQYKGQESIRYSGSILKYSFSEQHHNKSFTMVDIGQDGSNKITLLPLKQRRDLRVIRGTLEELVNAAKDDVNHEDFIQAVLTDSQALLNPMARLREHYPNILELKKERFETRTGQDYARSSEQLKRTDLDIFNDFFEQVHEQKLTGQQTKLLQKTLAEINEQERSS